MKGPEHTFDQTPMNAKRCWKCGLEETNSVHDYSTPVSNKSIEEYAEQDEIGFYFQKGFTQGYDAGDANAREQLRMDMDEARPETPDVYGPSDEEYQRAADSIDLSADEYLHRDFVSDERTEPTFNGMRFVVDEAIANFFNGNPVFLNLDAFYIDDNHKLWAKTKQGDELVGDMGRIPVERVPRTSMFREAAYECRNRLTGERVDCETTDINLVHVVKATPDGPCSCLAHRSANCSECFNVSPTAHSQEFVVNVRVMHTNEAAGDFDDTIHHLINQLYQYRGVTSVDIEVSPVNPRPNTSFGFGELGPSDLPVAGHYGFAPGQTTPLHGHEFENSLNATFSETDGREFQMPQGENTFSQGNVFITVHRGEEPELDVVGQMTVDEMLASVADITETIYPNQSSLLLPKFELVIRALYEQAGDSVNG